MGSQILIDRARIIRGGAPAGIPVGAAAEAGRAGTLALRNLQGSIAILSAP